MTTQKYDVEISLTGNLHFKVRSDSFDGAAIRARQWLDSFVKEDSDITFEVISASIIKECR